MAEHRQQTDVRRIAVIAMAIVTGLAIVAIVAFSWANPATPASTDPAAMTALAPTVPARTSEPASATPTVPLTVIPGDSSLAVGVEIEPGTYRTDGPIRQRDIGCYWTRKRSQDSGESSYIANGYSRDSPVTVVVQPGDVFFESSGCQDWRKVS
jgi:hypothetical protein